MRLLPVIFLGVLVGSPSAQAQTPAPPQAAAAATPAETPSPTSSGTFDLGARGTSLSGDSARFNRFRDLSNGLYFDNFSTAVEHGHWVADVWGTHAGRRDAQYRGELALPGRLRLYGSFQSMPWLVSNTAKTIFLGTGSNTLTIPDYVQSLLQTSASNISAVVPNLNPLTIDSLRKYSEGGLTFLMNDHLTGNLQVTHMDRSGTIVGEGTFGFSAADELPVPVRQHQTDVDASLEHASGAWLFRLGYSSSAFTNDNASITWDNPYQLTDKSTLSSTGRIALAPSDFLQTLSGTASVKLPMHTRVLGTVSVGSLTANPTILPETTNATVSTFTLDRTSVEGDGRTTAGNLIFTSRPTKRLDVDIRYRYYDYDNRTPIATQIGGRIEYDSTTELVPLSSPNTTTPFGLKTQTVDASATYDLGIGDVGAAYTRDASDFSFRLFEGTTTNAGRLTFDTTGSSWLSLHGRYEHSTRRGHGLDTTDLVAIGEQPTLQTFDIADRNEDVGTLTGSFLAASRFTINVTAGGGRDSFPVNALSTGFGLAHASYTTSGIGFAATPTDDVSLDVSYDRNGYKSLQDSRSASPGVQFTDPTRNWSATGNDVTQSVTGSLEVKNLIRALRLKVTFDYNKGSTLYLYGLAPTTTLPAVSQLPTVMSRLRRAMLDLSYPVAARATVGLGYIYEDFKVADFALDQTALAPIAIPSLLTLGNALLPYTAQTVFARMTYHW
jgi:MtrB/PioB family decaheme-associated outer membrane protein